jgi:hypothetical protein
MDPDFELELPLGASFGEFGEAWMPVDDMFM